DRTEHRQERRFRRGGHVFLQCRDKESATDSGPWRPYEAGEWTAGNRVELPVRLLDADIVSHASHHLQVVTPLAAVQRQRGVVLQRRPHFRGWTQHTLERSGHDPN